MELPVEFIEEMRHILPDAEADRLMEAISSQPSVSVRVNGSKLTDAASCGLLTDGAVPWCGSGYYLEGRPSFTMNPLLHCGAFYVQEASSMFVEQAVRKCVDGPVKALDLCAAPGGKSTHLCSLLPEGSVLVANEINRGRANILAENLTKWGNPNVVVTNDTPERIGASSLLFDLISVDAPCSGEGMFRKDETAITEWSAANVRMCAQRQREILRAVWPALRPGGSIIYSTCTYNSLEDEENVSWMIEELGAESVPVDVPEEWGVTGDLTCKGLAVYHFLPHKTRGEGFFLALLRKPGVYVPMPVRKASKPQKSADGPFRDWLCGADDFFFIERNGSIMAMPSGLSDFMTQASSELHTLSCGVEISVMRGRDWTPAHPLALCTCMSKSAFPSAEVSLQQALAYLHSEAVSIPDAPKGFVLLTYSGVPIGFVKNIGNRANNLYPQQWRIRKDVC